MKYDFSGYVTRNDIQCSDGRIIRHDAFKDNDGQKVPLVWQHVHDNPANILGHALLENRDDGVYGYCSLNNTEEGQKAKELIRHGDITAMSIYANHLKQQGSNVIHGMIREVSLVLAGANPGAYIENLNFAHSDGSLYESDEEAIIYTGLYLEHAEKEENEEEKEVEDMAVNDERTVGDVFESMSEKQKQVIMYLMGIAAGEIDPDDDMEHSSLYHEDEETVEDVFDSMSDEQQQVAYYLIGLAEEEADMDDEEDYEEELAQSDLYFDDEEVFEHGFLEGVDFMKRNVFDGSFEEDYDVISHDDMMAVINDSKRFGSMREAALQHGITNIEYLFPDARTINNAPDFIKREDEWVSVVMQGTHHTPFSRIKSIHANITNEEARARGYIKGKYKAEEVFALLRRTTTPQTVYKKQKLDRDDVVDITDFDVVAWLKTEMRMMLNEEIARAIITGDGRIAGTDDKINETNIRPIWTDEDLYTIKTLVTYSENENTLAKNFIRSAIKARKDYKGSGSPILFTTEDMLTDMLLLTDETGRDLYTSEQQLATKLRVTKIVTVPVMEHRTRDDKGTTKKLLGIIVNLSDYNIGADKGGEVNMFDDFDIDYNAQKYLIETRCSGALIRPYSAIALETVDPNEPGPTGETGESGE